MRFLVPFLAAAAVLLPSPGRAQPTPLILDQNRPDRPALPDPRATTPVTPPTGKVEAAPAASTSFLLQRVQVTGSSLPPATRASVGAGQVGRTVGAAELVRITDEVAKAYQASDVALYTVFLPQQDFAGGVLKILVVEGQISDVELDGDDAKTVRRAKRLAAPLTTEAPLRRSTLERRLSLIRDMPGVKVETALLRGASPSAVRLKVVVRLKRFEPTFSLNNRGSTYLGRTQVQADADFRGLFRGGDATHITLAAPTDFEKFRYVAVGHSTPVGDDGMMVSVNAGRLVTRPEIAGFDLRGKATTAGVQLSYPVIRNYHTTLMVTGGLDGVNSDNALFGARISADHSRAVRVAATYTRQAPKRTLLVAGSISKGVDVFGARQPDWSLADPDFIKVAAQGAVYQQVSRQAVLRLTASAQASDDVLPASEQYTLGGPQFGRAFPSAVISGSSGYAMAAEAAWRPQKLPALFAGSEVYGFVDGGKVRDRIFDRTESLASAGLGVRVGWRSRGVLELEAAKPIDTPLSRPDDKDWRFMLNVRSAI